MPAQQASQFPIGHYPEYNLVTLSTHQRSSFDPPPAPEVRAPQYAAATIARYPNPGHQYSSSFPQYAFPHNPPPASFANGHHHHHQNQPGLPWYSAPTLHSPTPTLEPTHQPSPALSHPFHPHFALAGAATAGAAGAVAGYHAFLPLHDSPHMDLENYQSFVACPAPPTSIPVSPTHSNPGSLSPSVDHAEYPSGALAEYSLSLPLAYDDPTRQPLLASLRNSPSADHPHRTPHSLPSYPGAPADDTTTPDMRTAHQYHLQPPTTTPSIAGLPITGSNRPRHAHHAPSTNLYSPYTPPRPPSSSSSTPDAPRPHVCGVCQAAFQRNHDLKRHKDVHSDTKPYVCQCGRAFTRKDALKRHIFLKSCGKDKGHESA